MNIQFSNWQNSKWPSSLASSSLSTITIFIGIIMTITEITTPIVITITEVHSQLLPNLYLHIPQINAVASINLPSRELTYPTWGKQKSSTQKCLFCGFFCDMWSFPGGVGLKTHPSRWILNPHLQVFEIQEQGGRISQAMATFYWWAAGLDEFHVLMSWRHVGRFWVLEWWKNEEKNTCWYMLVYHEKIKQYFGNLVVLSPMSWDQSCNMLGLGVLSGFFFCL